jgi:hypothetical protein
MHSQLRHYKDVSGQLHVPATTPQGRVPGNHWIGGWMGPRAGLDAVLRRKILSLPGIKLRSSRP